MSELRKDPIIGRWVIVAPERGKKISDFNHQVKKNNHEFCPFCQENIDKTSHAILTIKKEAADSDTDWKIRVIPNKLPALRVEGNLDREGIGIYDKMNGIGAHEIIIETPDHNMDIVSQDLTHIKDLFLAYKRRINDLRNDFRLKYVMIFKNHGFDAGALLEHSHSQLIATPVIPKRVVEELEGAKKYFDYKERCIFCDIIFQEIKENSRVVVEEENFIALEPFAARFPFETWIIPKFHYSNFEHSPDDILHHLAIIFKTVMKKLNQALNNPAYNLLIHTAPLSKETTEYYHWHIEIIPKLLHVAGFEWGTGFYLNPTAPEEAAKYLKELKI